MSNKIDFIESSSYYAGNIESLLEELKKILKEDPELNSQANKDAYSSVSNRIFKENGKWSNYFINNFSLSISD